MSEGRKQFFDRYSFSSISSDDDDVFVDDPRQQTGAPTTTAPATATTTTAATSTATAPTATSSTAPQLPTSTSTRTKAPTFEGMSFSPISDDDDDVFLPATVQPSASRGAPTATATTATVKQEQVKSPVKKKLSFQGMSFSPISDDDDDVFLDTPVKVEPSASKGAPATATSAAAAKPEQKTGAKKGTPLCDEFSFSPISDDNDDVFVKPATPKPKTSSSRGAAVAASGASVYGAFAGASQKKSSSSRSSLGFDPTARTYSPPKYDPKSPTITPPQRTSNYPPGFDGHDQKHLTSHTDSVWYVLRNLGSGTFGMVYVVRAGKNLLNLHFGREMAVKIIKVALDRTSRRAALNNEMQINRRLMIEPHQNVLSCVEAYKVVMPQEERGYFFMDLAEGGTLEELQYLTGQPKPFSLEETRWFAHGLAKGVAHLKSIGIAHCDLKITNILMFNNPDIPQFAFVHPQRYIPKLCDFSNSVESSEEDPKSKCIVLERMLCTLGFGPPEAYPQPKSGGWYDGYSVDVYSIACCMFEMLVADRMFKYSQKYAIDNKLYSEESLKYVRDQQVDDEVRRRINSNVPDDQKLRDVMERALAYRPEERITIEQMLEHPFFNEWTGVQ